MTTWQPTTFTQTPKVTLDLLGKFQHHMVRTFLSTNWQTERAVKLRVEDFKRLTIKCEKKKATHLHSCDAKPRDCGTLSSAFHKTLTFICQKCNPSPGEKQHMSMKRVSGASWLLLALNSHPEKALNRGGKTEKRQEDTTKQFPPHEFRCYRCVVMKIYLIS